MLMFCKLAWRNLFRNKRRSFIAGTAIGIGLAALIFVDALMIGMERNLIKAATASFLGEGQIHRQGFRETQEIEDTINALDTVVAALQQETMVAAITPRTLALGMITSPANAASVILYGIAPTTESTISQIDEVMQQGTYFEGSSERDLLIGSKLAELLEVGLGDRVVVTVAQAKSGDLSQEMFRVSGIFHFNIKEMDGMMAFIRLPRAQHMLALENRAHEIAIKFVDPEFARDKSRPFWQRYSQYGNEAVGWPVILPELEAAFELSDFSKYLTALILFGVVALGIINTLFMSLHERMFEFGLLRAVGTRPVRMALLIILEAGALAIISIVIGTVLGFGISAIVAKSGIDYTGIEMMGVTVRELLYPVMMVKQFIVYPFWVFVFILFISLYPALHAARLAPAEAMRKSL